MNLVFAISHFIQLRKANYVLHCSVASYVLCNVCLCCILYAVYCMLYSVHCMLCAGYCMLYTLCCVLDTVCCVLDTVCCILYALCCRPRHCSCSYSAFSQSGDSWSIPGRSKQLLWCAKCHWPLSPCQCHSTLTYPRHSILLAINSVFK